MMRNVHGNLVSVVSLVLVVLFVVSPVAASSAALGPVLQSDVCAEAANAMGGMTAEQPADTSAEAGTIVDIAMGNEDFSTLVAAVQAAGLVDVLADPNANWTVFAPTNDAFAALPAGAVDALLADTELLTRVLTYHVVEGRVTSDQISPMMAPSMEMTAPGADLIGSQLNVNVTDDGSVMINNATVTTADILASNGVIHVIDQVLLPEDIAAMFPAEGEGTMAEAPADTSAEAGTIVDIAVSQPDFSTLVSAVQAAGLVDVLADPNANWTVFAPTNAAFEALPEGALDALLADTELLTRVLTYHVVEGRVTSDQISPMMAPSMEMTAPGADLIGSQLNVNVGEDGSVMINDATVLAADILASNGVIHVIDRVLLPEDIAAMFPAAGDTGTMTDGTTIVDAVVANDCFTTLAQAVQAAGLIDVLADPNANWTVFAPTNDAFAALPAGALDALLADTELLTRVLTYHVVEGRVTSDQISPMMAPSMEMTAPGADLIGSQLNVDVADDGSVMINNARVLVADIETSNGVIHVIDQVLLPEDIAAMFPAGS